MRQYEEPGREKAFFELYGQWAPLPEETERKELLQSYNRVLAKTGIRRRPRRSGRVLLVAAVLTGALAMLAATAYGVSDAFRGHVAVHDSGPEAASSETPLLDRMGSVYRQKKESGGVEVSLRAAVGDGRTLKLLLDIENASGAPLALSQPDGTLSRGEYSLRGYDVTLSGESGGGFSANHTFSGGGPDSSRMTLLLEYSFSDVAVGEETIHLRLEDILQYGEQEGAALDIEGGLYALVSRFGDSANSDFQVGGYSAGSVGDEVYFYNLVADSSVEAPLSARHPGIQVTNAAVWNGALHLRGTALSQKEIQLITENAVLVPASGGPDHPLSAYGMDHNGERYVWTATFEGIHSLEELQGYAWRCGEGAGYHPLAEGVWDFEFQVDAENVTRTADPARTVSCEGYPLTVDRLELTPFALFLECSTDGETAERMFPPHQWGTPLPTSDWQEAPRQVEILLADGSSVTAAWPGTSVSWGGDGLNLAVQDISLHYGLEAAVDPAQVTGVRIGEQTIPLNG